MKKIIAIPVLKGQKAEGLGQDRKNIGKEKRGRIGADKKDAVSRIRKIIGSPIRFI